MERTPEEKKDRRIVLIVMMGVLLTLFLMVMFLLWTYRMYSLNQKETHSITLNNSIIDDSSSLSEGGKVFFYQSETEQVRFETNNGGIIGVKSHPESYIFGGEDYLKITFSLLDDTKIYNFSFKEIRVSTLSEDTSPRVLSKDEYTYNSSEKSLRYNIDIPTYIYSVAISYQTLKA